MDYFFVPMTQQFAEEVVKWHYPGVYSFYDQDADEEDRQEMLDPATWEHTFAAVDEGGSLVGFFDYTRHEDEVEIGLGLRPDLTGRGSGESFVRNLLDYLHGRFGTALFTLRVAEFNTRAITVYERVGFREVGRIVQRTNGGEYPFVKMALNFSPRLGLPTPRSCRNPRPSP